jgi:hypothetical protein
LEDPEVTEIITGQRIFHARLPDHDRVTFVEGLHM